MNRKRSPRFVLPRALRRLWLKLTWLVFAFDPWFRRLRQPCGYPIAGGATPICGEPAPFAFYCDNHQQPITRRLAFWWRS